MRDVFISTNHILLMPILSTVNDIIIRTFIIYAKRNQLTSISENKLRNARSPIAIEILPYSELHAFPCLLHLLLIDDLW